jgi:hypothetical protein
MGGSIEISVGDVTDMEARVIARWAGEDETGDPVVLSGTMRGPYCETARTLPAEFLFRDLGREAQAEAVVSDPCMWLAEMPHLYHVDVVARCGERVVAEYRGEIGLRRLAPRRPVDFAPGTG